MSLSFTPKPRKDAKPWHQQTSRLLSEAADKRGRWAEDRAAEHLERLSFTIAAKRAKTLAGEIDIIAHRFGLLVFAEVKYRRDTQDALWSIAPKQQKRIARAAEIWLAKQPTFTSHDMRFDAIIVNDSGVASHIEDAFRLDF